MKLVFSVATVAASVLTASMIERLRNVSPDARTVERMLTLVARSNTATEIAPRIREYGRELLDADYPAEQLHVDLMGAYKVVSEQGNEQREDAFLDAVDSLTGWWCPPGADLGILLSTPLPRRSGNDAPSPWVGRPPSGRSTGPRARHAKGRAE